MSRKLQVILFALFFVYGFSMEVNDLHLDLHLDHHVEISETKASLCSDVPLNTTHHSDEECFHVCSGLHVMGFFPETITIYGAEIQAEYIDLRHQNQYLPPELDQFLRPPLFS